MTGFVISDVAKAYGSHPVLTGVDLSIEAGSLTAILGASGSGKTTLLRILAGFERVDRGSVTLGDVTVDDGRRFVAPERRRLGYVPQEGALFPHLTVAANIAFGLPRRSRRGGRLRELLDLIGLPDLGGRYPHELSGGQQQRVALARALAVEPSLVLLDEPFSSLDAALRASVRADVTRVLRAAGATALLVTHDQDEALSMADRVAVLRDGVIAQVGTPRELYERPVDLDLARFLGEANVVAGVSTGGAASTPFGTVPLCAGSATGTVLVMLRPEQILVGTATGFPVPDSARGSGGAGSSGPVGVAGRVEELRYFGHDTILTVRPDAPDGAELIRVRIVGARDLTPGQDVTMTVSGPVPAYTGSIRDDE